MKNAFLKHLNFDEQNKISNDILYSSFTSKQINYKTIQAAGWINTKYSNQETQEHNSLFCFSGESKISFIDKSKNPIILYSTGSYAPSHFAHIHMLVLAAEKAENLGFEVSLIILSPSHDDYVLTKSNDISNYTILNRITILDETIKQYFTENPSFQKYQKLFHVDLFEGLFSKYAINFSEVLSYIKQSLKIIKPDIDFKFGYVFGSDNHNFSLPFFHLPKPKKDKYLAFCIEREGFNYFKNISENIFYISNSKYKDLKSREIRQTTLLKPNVSSSNNDGIYLIREDTSFSTQHWQNKYPQHKNHIEISYLTYCKKLEHLIKSHIRANVSTHLIDLKKQTSLIEPIIQNDKFILNVDACTNGHPEVHPIHFSRLFNLSDLQEKPIQITKRHQLDLTLKPGEYSFMDDDIASGFTLSTIKSQLEPLGIKINKTYNLSKIYLEQFNISYQTIYDIVDARDFLFGSFEGGLVCLHKGVNIRVPYLYPWINLRSRASIINYKEFSIEILKLNKEFFKENPYLSISDFYSDPLIFNNLLQSFNGNPILLFDYLTTWIESHSN